MTRTSLRAKLKLLQTRQGVSWTGLPHFCPGTHCPRTPPRLSKATAHQEDEEHPGPRFHKQRGRTARPRGLLLQGAFPTQNETDAAGSRGFCGHTQKEQPETAGGRSGLLGTGTR